MLVKCLLKNGYAVNATVRHPANSKKVKQLLDLQGLGDLKLFKADLSEDGSFEEAISGCDFVFHVASPIHFQSQEPENDMVNSSINRVSNVLKSCAKVKTSIAAVSGNEFTGMDLVLDEDSWSDVDYLTSKSFGWGYAVSKTLAEKMAFEFGKENILDVISINPVLIVGESLTEEVPHSVIVAALSLLTGNGWAIDWLKSLQLHSGVLPVVRVMDVCRAHIVAAEEESCSGRYICSAFDATVPELAIFLAQRYPQYYVPTRFDDLPAKPTVRISSQKLIKAGFTYNYGIEETCDDSVKYFKAVGLLAK